MVNMIINPREEYAYNKQKDIGGLVEEYKAEFDNIMSRLYELSKNNIYNRKVNELDCKIKIPDTSWDLKVNRINEFYDAINCNRNNKKIMDNAVTLLDLKKEDLVELITKVDKEIGAEYKTHTIEINQYLY